VNGESIRLSACFGVALSMGRSPVVVLREAEQALQWAKASGPESIEYFGEAHRPPRAPVTYLSPTSGDELVPGNLSQKFATRVLQQGEGVILNERGPKRFSAGGGES